MLDLDLGRPDHMAGRVKAEGHAVELDDLAIFHGLRRPGEFVAVTQPHDVEGFLGCHYRVVTRARVVGVAMGDERLGNGPRRVDMEPAWLATHARRRRNENVFGA